MAISFVAASTVATGASPTVSLPTGWSQGNLLLIATSSITTTVSTPSGWTSIGATSGSGIYIFYKFAGASESSVNLSGGSASAVTYMVAYTGVLANDVNSTQSTALSSSATTNAITTTKNYDLIISFYSVTNGSVKTMSTPSGTSSRANSASTVSLTGLSIVDEIQNTSGASSTRTSTLSVSTTWYARAVSFSPTTGDFFRMF